LVEEVIIDCPACGESMALDVDTTGGEEQSYFEDCAVCCRPNHLFITVDPGRRSASIDAEPL